MGAGLAAGLLVFGQLQTARCQTNDLSGRTPDSIRNVLRMVAAHRLRSLADGAYPVVYTTNAAAAAAKPAGLEWDYQWGLALYGMLQQSRATGDTNVENFALTHNLIAGRYYNWLLNLQNTCTNSAGAPANLAGLYSTTVLSTFFTLGKLDYCGAMTAQLLEGALNHAAGPTPEQVRVCTNTANYISNVQARYIDGTLYRPERGYTIWADDLFMSCPFLVRWYEYTGNTNLLNDAIKQVMNQAGYLQDTNGLWFHGYLTTNSTVNGVKWGRANGWAMVTTAEILSIMPANYPNRTNLLNILRRHIAGIETVQAADGMWHQVVDRSDSYEESSCTAMFTYAITRAVNRGWIDPTNMVFAYKGFLGLCTHIGANGAVNQVCPGTSLSTDINYYMTTQAPANDDPHGPGPAMLAGAELLLGIASPPPALAVVTGGTNATISWPVTLTNYTFQTSTDLVNWAGFSYGPAVSNGFNTVTDAVTAGKFYRLLSPRSPDYEAEVLTYATYFTNGAAATNVTDSSASGGYWFQFTPTNINQFVEFTLPPVSAGTFAVKLKYKTGTGRGQMALLVDGAQLGGTLDQYQSSTAYPTNSFGNVTFTNYGSHKLRLLVTGKNASSSSYVLSADRFTLTPLLTP
jgi:rhamnogalacturonyl hydrolase YesR